MHFFVNDCELCLSKKMFLLFFPENNVNTFIEYVTFLTLRSQPKVHKCIEICKNLAINHCSCLNYNAKCIAKKPVCTGFQGRKA